MLCPINFSIPKNKIVDAVPEKTKLLSSLIPGDTSTYIYETEEEYYTEYRTSRFARTNKKGGWDCLRHYEILANGCIPYFPDLPNCPPKIMTLLPKDLLLQGNDLYLRFCKENADIPALIIEYDHLANLLLDYTKKNLSTVAMAKYVIEKIGKPVKRVLYLSGNTDPDYLRCLTLHGMKCLLECDDFPRISHLYKDCPIPASSLYGKGMSYTNLLDPEPPIQYDTVINRVNNRYYDLIIYGSYHRGMPLYSEVLQQYSSRDIILLCGEDDHACNAHLHVNNGHIVFVRECR